MLYARPYAEWLYKVGTNAQKLQVQAESVTHSKDSEQFTGPLQLFCFKILSNKQ